MEQETIRTERNYSQWLIMIAILLFLNVLGVGYQIYKSEIRASEYAERLENTKTMVSIQKEAIFSLIVDYRNSAYGPNVDRIAEQQLIATEYTLQALQIIALQNTQIIEFLSITP